MTEVVRLKINSRLENIAKVESMIETLRVQYAINDEQYGNMLLASVEAVTNAIEHGNNLDEQKIVDIEACKCDASFKLSVRDQGRGFNPDRLPDPTTPEFREQPDGRGVFLMRKLADEVFFRDGGRCVEMRFLLS
ncbi:MAG: ATP-binding protein [Sphingobacteriales bacterium]|jgi:serine/threonine-protein kinase RsbW|nr:ATP-binding protein [Sphingobacteriales bacterium]MCC6583707.1 ATP-binding protein [Chitinophagales bacterium]